jgi:hypothetical protein
MDGRRRPWFAVSVDVLHSRTGTKLQQLGPGAVEAWIGLLAAAKRSPIEGRVSYASESEAWATIGITKPETLSFTLEDLLKTLGTQKQTRRTRRGRITNIEITQWERWQKSRSGARNTEEIPGRKKRNARSDKDKTKTNDIDRWEFLKSIPPPGNLNEERERQKSELAKLAEASGA